MYELDFRVSADLLEKALRVIPNGTQTFSKSRTQYPVGFAPLFAKRAHGCTIETVDHYDFLDTVSGLGSIILGYGDDDVDRAVEHQVKEGAIFSLPSTLEIEVSETLKEIIPSAEMVRFGKNGSDVTSGAVRLARYVTGKEHVACCGYHGWQDWYICTTARDGGVPDAVKQLTHKFEYNDIESLEKIMQENFGNVACLIMEPVIHDWPYPEFLKDVQEVAREHSALFILDEMLTGFRMPGLSAQKFLGVTPDLSCFGKSMANGYPLSALVGKADIMRRLEELHFSFTFGGDCIALAAARETLSKLKPMFLQARLRAYGKTIRYAISENCENAGIDIGGYPERLTFKFRNDEQKWKIMQEMIYKHQILWIGALNLTHAYTPNEIVKLIVSFNDILPRLDEIELKFKPIDPLFKIR